MKLSLEGKVALVTGGARDVGRAIALVLAAEGCAVAVNYRNSAIDAQCVVNEIHARGGSARAYQADIADLNAVRAMIKAIVADLGSLAIVVNNAGLAIPGRFVDTDETAWKRQIDTCLYGVIHVTHAAAPHLLADGAGRIISIIGDSSRVGEPGLSIAAAARGGVLALMKSLAKENGPQRGDGQHRFAWPGRNGVHPAVHGGEPRQARQGLSCGPVGGTRRYCADHRAPGIASRVMDHGASHKRLGRILDELNKRPTPNPQRHLQFAAGL